MTPSKSLGSQVDGRNLVSRIVLAEAHPYDDELLRRPVRRRLDEAMLRKLDIREAARDLSATIIQTSYHFLYVLDVTLDDATFTFIHIRLIDLPHGKKLSRVHGIFAS